jgi:hypothetical protein
VILSRESLLNHAFMEVRMKQSVSKISAVLCAAILLACGGSDTTAPNPLVGSYFASQWTTTGGSGQTNQLLAGSTLNIALNSDGTTSGHLHVAAGGGNPAFDADMAGTWRQEGLTVTFTQTADTFVRDTPFTVVANGSTWALTADHVFSGQRIQLTLSRSGIV